ncbi:NAD(P)H-dependent amine dehydrogenase family protein [Fodinibius sediminis]|uniref:4-hydroxy-tetrahydrodipicolinate reductase n=1 Tax=Fodinibius sediminis TaxID=1214077 RepID=A0A521CTB7_9BACT|nr:dihydrodipicolinate reductase [Fodinibius sediminis]SMO61880.1 4-hydroxy-tetrahydrodipicolinate reductase [Fodinibius sediminis]
MKKIVQIGVGPLGQKIVKNTLQREEIHLVGAVDPDPEKAGKDLGELCGCTHMGIPVSRELTSSIKGRGADVAVVSTFSSLERIEPQLAELADAKLNIVSTCEELSYPWQTQPDIAQRIDKVCRDSGVTCLGTGVNPGFLMDYLPAVMSSICQDIEQIKVTRVQDASIRRIPFQRKIGAGLTAKQFSQRKKNGHLRHIGLTESVHMIARALCWRLDRVEETLDPVVAARLVSSGYKDIRQGQASGVEQYGRGYVGEEEKITLHFRAAVGEEKSHDKIEIVGTPSFTSVIEGGINGDIATAAITLNAISAVLRAESGLKTMLEIPVPSFSGRFCV